MLILLKSFLQTNLRIQLILVVLFNLYIPHGLAQKNSSVLNGKTIFVDAGHGGTAVTDSYRQGPTGEREEWIDLRIALLLQKMLEDKGAKVVMTRTTDLNIPIADRAKSAVDNKADLFISIHHNATADPQVNFPIIYYNGTASENLAGVELGKCLARTIPKYMYKRKTQISLVSDNTIFPGAGLGVLRGTYGIPGVLAEASFFTNPKEESDLKLAAHNQDEAVAYVKALEAFFSKKIPPVLPKDPVKSPPPFKAAQEAERMNEIARRWNQDFIEGQALMKHTDTTSLRQAYDLFTRSARSFPDSYVAAKCHAYRAVLLRKLGKPAEAAQEEKRVKEYYVTVK
jgi:N-acetylmuramoyl-L-alanine amidase